MVFTNESYDSIKMAIYELMEKSENNLSRDELATLSIMAEAAEKYEDSVFGVDTREKRKLKINDLTSDINIHLSF